MRVIDLIVRLAVPVLAIAVAGCSGMARHGLAESVADSMVNQIDPEIVKDAMPAYLLMVDGFVQEAPEDAGLLIDAAKLFGAYASIFVDDPVRAERLALKAREYGHRALCQRVVGFCLAEPQDFDGFDALVAQLERDDVPAAYSYATAWAGWVQHSSHTWSSIADLPRIERLLERVVALDEGYDFGQAHVYLGVMRSKIPAAMGGQPERGRAHFERAIALSAGKNLIAKVEYARNYARLVFDRDLHDRLLGEVLAADPVAPGLTLSNVLAQEQARILLKESDDYF